MTARWLVSHKRKSATRGGGFLLADGEAFFRRAPTDAGLNLVDLCDAAQALGGDLGTILLINVVQLAPGMCPAVSQRQRRATHAPELGQGIIPGIAVDLQDAVKAPQNLHRMAATAPRRIGEDDRRGIAAIPAAIIAGQRPEIAGLGFARPRVHHWGAGLIHEEFG